MSSNPNMLFSLVLTKCAGERTVRGQVMFFFNVCTIVGIQGMFCCLCMSAESLVVS